MRASDVHDNRIRDPCDKDVTTGGLIDLAVVVWGYDLGSRRSAPERKQQGRACNYASQRNAHRIERKVVDGLAFEL